VDAAAEKAFTFAVECSWLAVYEGALECLMDPNGVACKRREVAFRHRASGAGREREVERIIDVLTQIPRKNDKKNPLAKRDSPFPAQLFDACQETLPC